MFNGPGFSSNRRALRGYQRPRTSGERFGQHGAAFFHCASSGARAVDQITLFDSVGFATEDFSAVRYVYDQIQKTEYYQNLDLLADPDDPRDLYGMLQRSKEDGR